MSKYSSFKEFQLITENWRKYFLHETVLREAGGGAGAIPHFSPLSATKPGERIPVPGSQRPYEQRDIDGNVAAIAEAFADVDERFEALVAVVAKPDADGYRGAPPELWELRNAIELASARFASLQNRIGEDPRAPRLEEE